MTDLILNILKTLKLKGMLDNFKEITKSSDKWEEILFNLLKAEASYKESRSLMYRLKLAKLPQIKTIDSFNIAESELSEKTIKELKECNYIKDAQNILFIGGSGTGKTHLAISLAYMALQNKYRARFYKFRELAKKLLEAKEFRCEEKLIASLQRFDLLVIDELGYLPIEKEAGILLFELFSNLYEKNSLVITTHLHFNEWDEVFGNLKSTKNMIDRITHHCKILETGDSSWRLKESSKQNKL